MHEAHKRSLEALTRRRRLRMLQPPGGLDFASNDYLGLGASDALRCAARAALDRGVPVGAGASRLLRGNHPEHEALESEAAQFFGAETALFFSGGFHANSALFSTLPQRGDLVLHDQFIHASAHDGMAITRAKCISFAHNDPEAAANAINDWRRAGGKGRIWIAVETLYSMDGDIAPLDALAELADRNDAMLVIDEAHATGVYGPEGRGLGAALEGRENIVALHTCGKALGASGAFLTMPSVLHDYMINRARAFIYATAPSPLMAAIARAALKLVQEEPQRRHELATLVDHAGTLLRERCAITPTGTQIQPVIVHRDERALHIAHALQEAGFDVRAIRPPTVPDGTARLRLSLTLNVTPTDVTNLIDQLAPMLTEAPP